MTTHTTRHLRALAKARTTSARPIWAGGDRWRVRGEHGTKYTVSATDWRCTCRAGELGVPCYHAARLQIHLVPQVAEWIGEGE
jgi:hypothetical protein